MKIIHVTGCEDCPYATITQEKDASVALEISPTVTYVNCRLLSLSTRIDLIRSKCPLKDSIEFTFCYFNGKPPTGFNNWWQWAAAHPRSGAFIRAIRKQDLPKEMQKKLPKIPRKTSKETKTKE